MHPRLVLLVATTGLALAAGRAAADGPDEAQALSDARLKMLDEIYGPQTQLVLDVDGRPANEMMPNQHIPDLLRIDKRSDLEGPPGREWAIDDFMLRVHSPYFDEDKSYGFRIHALRGKENERHTNNGFTYRHRNLLNRLEEVDARTQAQLTAPGRQPEPVNVAPEPDERIAAARRARIALMDTVASVVIDPQGYEVASADAAIEPRLLEIEHALPHNELVRSSRVTDAHAAGDALYVQLTGSPVFYKVARIGNWRGGRLRYDDLLEDVRTTYADGEHPAKSISHALLKLLPENVSPHPAAPIERLGPYVLRDLVEVVPEYPEEGERGSGHPLLGSERVERLPNGDYGVLTGSAEGFYAPKIVLRLAGHELAPPIEPGATASTQDLADWAIDEVKRKTGKTEAELLGEYDSTLRALADRHQDQLVALAVDGMFGGHHAIADLRRLRWSPEGKHWSPVYEPLESREHSESRRSNHSYGSIQISRARGDRTPRRGDTARQEPDVKWGEGVWLPNPSGTEGGELSPEQVFGLWFDRANMVHNYVPDTIESDTPVAVFKSRTPQAPDELGALRNDGPLRLEGPVAGGGRLEPLEVEAKDVSDLYGRDGLWHVRLRHPERAYVFQRLAQAGVALDAADPRFAVTDEELRAEPTEERDQYLRVQHLRDLLPEPKAGDVFGKLAGSGDPHTLSSVDLTDGRIVRGTGWFLTAHGQTHHFREDGFSLLLNRVPLRTGVPSGGFPGARRRK